MAEIVSNKNLTSYNSFGIDITADYYAEFHTTEELQEIFDFQEKNQLEWYILGGGSNILFTSDYKGLIIHPIANSISIADRKNSNVFVRADAGVIWDRFVEFAVDHGLWGIENLYGIPGFVGSSPIQNIGAYGIEAKDTLYSVKFYHKDRREIISIPALDCRLGYRDSIFKRELKGRGVILSVIYKLSEIVNPKLGYGDLKKEVESRGEISLRNISESVISIRNRKLPDPKITGNCGSFFKNPIVSPQHAVKLKEKYPEMPVYSHGDKIKIAAGWLIDIAGWKGYRNGDVGVHDKQALVLVNHGKCTGTDIIALSDNIKKDIKSIFDIDIETEVNIL